MFVHNLLYNRKKNTYEENKMQKLPRSIIYTIVEEFT